MQGLAKGHALAILVGMQWQAAIKAHYSAPLKLSFMQFRWGVVIFFIGLVIIYAGSQVLEHSLAQELVTLLGLMVIGVGFLIAMMAQIRMVISRVVIFFTS